MQPSVKIKVGARGSPLSKKQVEEVAHALSIHFPQAQLQPIFVTTKGDRDKNTSLRALDKTNFFTYEIDEMLLKGECRIAVHSAKDLPEPLPKGLVLVALTKGVDPSDSLVLREGEKLAERGTVATSSVRREECVQQLFPHARFVDIRGTIEERLEKLFQGEVDGVVIAEAALIRLGLAHLNRITLPGETTPFQGRLAILAREGDQEMRELFTYLSL